MSKQSTPNRDDAVTNQILAIFLFTFALIVGLTFVSRAFSNFQNIYNTQIVLYIVSAVSLALSVAGLVWMIAARRKGVDTKNKLVCGRSLMVVGLMILICAFLSARFLHTGVQVLYVFVPVVAALLLVYLIYPTDFFTIALITAAGAILLWLFTRYLPPGSVFAYTPDIWLKASTLAGLIVSLVLLAAAAVGVRMLQKRHGELVLGGTPRRVMRKMANYLLMYGAILLAGLCVIISYLFGSTVAYYLMFVEIGYLFITAVYYTVKLM